MEHRKESFKEGGGHLLSEDNVFYISMLMSVSLRYNLYLVKCTLFSVQFHEF